MQKFYVMPYNSRYSQLRKKEIFELNKFASKSKKLRKYNNYCFGLYSRTNRIKKGILL